ncbi:MAG: hypothetical protein WBA94_06285, partial [Ferruginibacter sp.]
IDTVVYFYFKKGSTSTKAYRQMITAISTDTNKNLNANVAQPLLDSFSDATVKDAIPSTNIVSTESNVKNKIFAINQKERTIKLQANSANKESIGNIRLTNSDNNYSKSTHSKKVKEKLNTSITNAGTENTENKDLQNYEDEEPFNAASENYQKTANNNLPKEEPQSGTDSAHKQRELTIDSIRIYENDSLPISKKETPAPKTKASKFYFSLLSGAEGSGVKFPGLNKFSLRAGFSAGYYLSKRVSIQAGFFKGTKKYIAGKKDYKAKPGSYWGTVDIKRVDANCLVYEIPVSVRYDFSTKNNWQIFAGTGISSFIMKKEEYAYDYIYYNTLHHAKASYNGNKHLFSVLRIDVGVERKFKSNFSIFVQPGLAIPMAGVGEGQIKLFSSEILIGLKFKPQKKN